MPQVNPIVPRRRDASTLAAIIRSPEVERMMRAIEFASRLGFQIEEETYAAIIRHKNEILKASPPRVSEEILELLRRGWSRGAIRLMVDSGLLEPLLPEVYRAIAGELDDLDRPALRKKRSDPGPSLALPAARPSGRGTRCPTAA